MLIALYLFIAKVALPQVRACAQTLSGPIMVIFIAVVGITIIGDLIGTTTFNSLGSIVVSEILRTISYFFRTIIEALGWIFRNLLIRLIPSLFYGVRRTLFELHINEMVSNLLALLIVLAIII